MRVAKIPYLNSVPFFRGLSLGERYPFVECVPKALAEQAAAGDVVAGLLPVVDLFRLHATFEPLGRAGIAVRGRVRSVLLFSRQPIRQLGGATIAITEETSTSVVLLRLLLMARYELAPPSYQRGRSAEAEALLLIGDEALRFRRTNTRYPFEIDLAFEWWLWQHLPFVFAVWAARKDVEPEAKRHIEIGLMRALAINSGQLEAIAQEVAPAMQLPAQEIQSYLAGFVYRFGQAEDEAIARFKALVNEHHLL